MSKIGSDLAEKVGAVLIKGHRLVYNHRDFCGTGMEFYKGQFIYGYVEDGDIRESLLVFDQLSDFTNWLSEQTDKTLSGIDHADSFYRNNQRVTKERLELFVSKKSL